MLPFLVSHSDRVDAKVNIIDKSTTDNNIFSSNNVDTSIMKSTLSKKNKQAFGLTPECMWINPAAFPKQAAPEDLTSAQNAESSGKRFGANKHFRKTLQAKLSSCIIKKSQQRVCLEIELQMNK